MFEGPNSSLAQTFFKAISETPEDRLKKIKKDCFYRCKAEYRGKKPFGVYWTSRTWHLKTLSDWSYAKSDADQVYQQQLRNKVKDASWFKIFIGSLKEQEWQKK